MLNLILSTLFVISSQSWFSVWCGLEYNLISFIPILMTSPSTKSTESSIKYFVIQATASIVLLLSAMMLNSLNLNNLHLLIVLSLMVKVGITPFHQWVPNVISSISWPNLFLMLTWQKIAPIFVLSTSTYSSHSYLLVISAGVSSIAGGLGGMNQTQVRHLIAFSSIGHMGWVLIAAILNPATLLVYFTVYILNLLPLVVLLKFLSVSTLSTNVNMMSLSKQNAILLFMLFFSLGGLPPFLGFAPKLMVMKGVLVSFPLIILVMLLAGSLMNIYYYFSYSVVYFMSPGAKPSNFPTEISSKFTSLMLLPV
uniref:NADH-ubiquinone oxidoreductase chain 2 n=1 Tax=Chaetopterus variopedatus TaxID=34590 RepID=A0A0S2N0E2_CHAVR|nr:NADH dehydrogenase subunit 2 [Chaetopterus variopedatus]ALO81669.1 NADH dehydrogenase subunit 2 [Chaetopterus variopedatus]